MVRVWAILLALLSTLIGAQPAHASRLFHGSLGALGCVLIDGSLTAPAGTPNYPNLMAGYVLGSTPESALGCKVAGADFLTGPAIAPTLDPATLTTLPFSYNSSTHVLRCDDVAKAHLNPKVNGYDFTMHGGVTVNDVSCAGLEIDNSNFAITGTNCSTVLIDVASGVAAPGLTLLNDDIDGGSGACPNMNEVVEIGSGGTVTIEYVHFHNVNQHFISLGGAITATVIGSMDDGAGNAGNILHVSSTLTGALAIGQYISTQSVPNTVLGAQIISGSNPTWVVSGTPKLILPPCTVTATQTTGSAGTLTISAVGTCAANQSFATGQTVSGGSFSGTLSAPCTLSGGVATCSQTGGTATSGTATINPVIGSTATLGTAIIKYDLVERCGFIQGNHCNGIETIGGLWVNNVWDFNTIISANPDTLLSTVLATQSPAGSLPLATFSSGSASFTVTSGLSTNSANSILLGATVTSSCLTGTGTVSAVSNSQLPTPIVTVTGATGNTNGSCSFDLLAYPSGVVIGANWTTASYGGLLNSDLSYNTLIASSTIAGKTVGNMIACGTGSNGAVNSNQNNTLNFNFFDLTGATNAFRNTPIYCSPSNPASFGTTNASGNVNMNLPNPNVSPANPLAYPN